MPEVGDYIEGAYRQGLSSQCEAVPVTCDAPELVPELRLVRAVTVLTYARTYVRKYLRRVMRIY